MVPLHLLTQDLQIQCLLIQNLFRVRVLFLHEDLCLCLRNDTLKYEYHQNVIGRDVSDQMKMLLEKVVAEGTGKKCYIEGYRIGGKTATSQKLPRGAGKYIASFIGFAPADDPKIVGIVMIDEPVGAYYGGTVAAPVMREIFENVLPYYLGEQPEIINETGDGNE